jgi:hypothetical protein
MTGSYGPGSYGPGPGSGPGSTGQLAREKAQDAAAAGGHVAQTALEQGQEVVRETGAQVRNLMGEATDELRHQAGNQQKRAAEGLRALGSQLRSMAGAGEQGVAADLVGEAADRANQAAQWLEQREPGQLVDEVRGFARRRPGAFAAGALVAGVLVGRLTRSLARSGTGTGTDTGTSTGTGTAGYVQRVQPTATVASPAEVTRPLPVGEPVLPPVVGRTELRP